VADGHRAEHILRYLRQVGVAEPYPTKAIYPPIFPGENDWRAYYRSRNLNLPHQYHNGGIWPMIGGFHVAALVRHKWSAAADQLLVALANANRQGLDDEWEFNEWLHGESGHPMGYAQQAWSATMFLYAEHAVRTGELRVRRSAGRQASLGHRSRSERYVRCGRAVGRCEVLGWGTRTQSPIPAPITNIMKAPNYDHSQTPDHTRGIWLASTRLADVQLSPDASWSLCRGANILKSIPQRPKSDLARPDQGRRGAAVHHRPAHR